jgi:hypothetical protein
MERWKEVRLAEVEKASKESSAQSVGGDMQKE